MSWFLIAPAELLYNGIWLNSGFITIGILSIQCHCSSGSKRFWAYQLQSSCPVMCPSHNSLLSFLCTLQVLLNGWKILELWVACWSSDKLHNHILHNMVLCASDDVQHWTDLNIRNLTVKITKISDLPFVCNLFSMRSAKIYSLEAQWCSACWHTSWISWPDTGFNAVPNIILHSHLWFFGAEICDCGKNGSFQKWKLPLSSFEFVCLGKHITLHLQKPKTSDHFVSDGQHTAMQFPPDYFYWEGERLLWCQIDYNTHKHMCASENARNCKMVCCLKLI
jgi:hypothetical protein